MNKNIIIWMMTFVLLSSFASALDYTANNTLWVTLNDAVDATALEDLSPSGYDLTNNGATNNFADNAFSFVTNDYLDGTNPVATEVFSVSIWFKSSETSAEQYIVNSRPAASDGYWLRAEPASNRLRFLLYDGATAQVVMVAACTNACADNAWHHLVGTFSSGDSDIYLDGSHVLSYGDTWTETVNPGNIFIASDTSGANNYDGNLSAVVAWNTIINSSDVATLYANGRTYNPYLVNTSNFTISMQDVYDSSGISNVSANVTLPNGTSQIFTNSTGSIITTSILNNLTGLVNVTFSQPTYFGNTSLNVNVTTTLTATMGQALVKFNATDIFNNTLTGNYTVGSSTVTDYQELYIKAGTYNVTYQNASFIPAVKEFTISALDNTTETVTNIFNKNFGIEVLDFVTNGSIATFNVTVVSSENSYSAVFNGTSGNISIPLIDFYLYNITVRSAGYLIGSNQNYNISTNLTEYMHSSTSMATFIDSNTTSPITGKGITITYPGGFQLPLITDGNGSVSWVTIVNGIELYGVYNITFNSTDGYDSPQSFLENITVDNAPLNVSYNISPATLNITIRDQSTGDLITASTILTIVGIGEFNVTGGNLIIRNGSISAGTYTAYAFSAGYATGQTSFEYDAREVEDVEIYLLNSTESTTGSLSVIVFDEVFNTQANVDTRLLQYFPSSNSFIEVNQCFTNSNGECIFSIIVGEKLYKVTATTTVGNEVLTGQSSQNGEIIFVDEYQIEIHLFSDITYTAPDLLGFSIDAQNITLISNISYLTGVWSDIYSNSHQVCIRYNYINNTLIIPLSGGLNCASGISGEINVLGGYNLTAVLATSDVYVELFVNDTNGDETLYYSTTYSSTRSFQSHAGDLAPYLLIILWTTVLGLMLYLKNVYIFGVGNIIASILSISFLPTYFGWETVSAMIVLSFVLFYLSRKKEGNIEV